MTDTSRIHDLLQLRDNALLEADTWEARAECYLQLARSCRLVAQRIEEALALLWQADDSEVLTEAAEIAR